MVAGTNVVNSSRKRNIAGRYFAGKLILEGNQGDEKGEMPPIKTFPRKQNKQMVSFMRRNLFSCPTLKTRELADASRRLLIRYGDRKPRSERGSFCIRVFDRKYGSAKSTGSNTHAHDCTIAAEVYLQVFTTTAIGAADVVRS